MSKANNNKCIGKKNSVSTEKQSFKVPAIFIFLVLFHLLFFISGLCGFANSSEDTFGEGIVFLIIMIPSFYILDIVTLLILFYSMINIIHNYKSIVMKIMAVFTIILVSTKTLVLLYYSNKFLYIGYLDLYEYFAFAEYSFAYVFAIITLIYASRSSSLK